MITKYLSDKIRLLSFILILVIVFLHSQMISISSGVVLNIQQFFNLGVTRIGVPMFFMISGFLFFKNPQDKLDLSYWKNKISNRIRSLLVPYLLWSLIGICFVKVTLSIPVFSSFYEDISINKSFLYELINSLLKPIRVVYQLWFIRDLFAIVLMSPLIYILVKRIPIIYFFILEIFYTYSFAIFQVSSVMSFSIGVLIALYYNNLLYKSVKVYISLILFVLWLLLCGIIVFLEPILDVIQFVYLQQSIIYVGIVSVWLLYDNLYKYVPNKIFKSSILSMSFWIFLSHEPVLTVVKKLMLKYIGNNNVSILFIYIVSPIITIFFILIIGVFMRKYFKPVYSILVGGRV